MAVSSLRSGRSFSSEWIMPPSSIGHANLTCVVSGEAGYVLNDCNHRVRQGTLIRENPIRFNRIQLEYMNQIVMERFQV